MKDAATIFTLPLTILQPVRRVSGLCRGLLAELRKSKMAREERDRGRDGAGLDWRTDSVGELVGISARRRRRSSTPDAATWSCVRPLCRLTTLIIVVHRPVARPLPHGNPPLRSSVPPTHLAGTHRPSIFAVPAAMPLVATVAVDTCSQMLPTLDRSCPWFCVSLSNPTLQLTDPTQPSLQQTRN